VLKPPKRRGGKEHGGFRRHLEGRYREVVEREDTCLIFDLREPRTERTGATMGSGEDTPPPAGTIWPLIG
jgi:hypothetical protein